MWPQKWKASASPGLTMSLTAAAAPADSSAPPTRASSPRREVRAAIASLQPSPMQQLQRVPRLPGAALGRGDDRLQLAQPVEGALRQDGPVDGIERDRVRAPGDRGGG